MGAESYDKFLLERRKLMAKKIKDYYFKLQRDIEIYAKDYQRIYQKTTIIEGDTAFQTFDTYISNFKPLAHQSNYKFNNLFLGQITGKQQFQKWVDIEVEYYYNLLNCLKNKKNITKLNENFYQIQILLQKYLAE